METVREQSAVVANSCAEAGEIVARRTADARLRAEDASDAFMYGYRAANALRFDASRFFGVDMRRREGKTLARENALLARRDAEYGRVVADLLEEAERCRLGNRLVMPSYITKRLEALLAKVAAGGEFGGES